MSAVSSDDNMSAFAGSASGRALARLEKLDRRLTMAAAINSRPQATLAERQAFELDLRAAECDRTENRASTTVGLCPR